MKPRKIILFFFSLFCVCASAGAQDCIKSSLELRAGYNTTSAFTFDRMALKLSGSMGDGFTFFIRHHLNRPLYSGFPLAATDFAYLDWSPDGHWYVKAGKSYIEYGTVEFYKPPIDVFFWSEYCSNITAFVPQVSAGYRFDGGRDELNFQWARSPFCRFDAGAGTFDDPMLNSFNASWRHETERYSEYISINTFEHLEGNYTAHLASGTRTRFGAFELEFDLVFRTPLDNNFNIGNSLSEVINLNYTISPKFEVFAKNAFDYNESMDADEMVYKGTNLGTMGAGVCFFPKNGSRDIRLHACLTHTYGQASQIYSAITPDVTTFAVGLTWHIGILNYR